MLWGDPLGYSKIFKLPLGQCPPSPEMTPIMHSVSAVYSVPLGMEGNDRDNSRMLGGQKFNSEAHGWKAKEKFGQTEML